MPLESGMASCWKGGGQRMLTGSNGITVGCGEANNLARVAVFRLAEETSRSPSLAELGQYVDDIKVFVRAPTACRAKEVAVAAAVTFIKTAKEENLVVSTKSVVLASSKALAASSSAGLGPPRDGGEGV